MKNIQLLFVLLVSTTSLVFSQGFEVIAGAAPMNITRYNHVSVALPDGKVLVIGGHTQGFGITSTAEIFDPQTSSWTLYNIDNVHDGSSFVELSDGRFMFFGGFSSGGGSGQSNATTIFDPVTSIFSNGPTMNVSRAFSTAVKLTDNRVLIAGNWYNTGDAEIFDPITNTFTSIGIPISERSNPLVFPCNDGGAVILGGYGIYGSPNYSDIVYFDPINSQFSTLSTELIAGETGWITSWYSNHAQIAEMKMSNGNYIFMIYKVVSASEYQYAFAEFNPATKEVTKITSTPEIPFYSGTSPNEWAYGLNLMKDPLTDFVYFVAAASSTSPVLTRLYSFDPQSGTLEIPIGEMGLDYYLYSSSKSWVNGDILCTGGTIDGSNSNITNEAKIIRPQSSLNVSDLDDSRLITVYPNPVSTNYFQISASNLAISTIEILDIRGTVLQTIRVDENDDTYLIERGSLKHGVYFLRMSGLNEVYFKEILFD